MSYELNWFWLVVAAGIGVAVVLHAKYGIPYLLRSFRDWVTGKHKEVRKR